MAGVWGAQPAESAAGAAGRLASGRTATAAQALVHGIRGAVGNLLFRLYVGQEWLSTATLSTGAAPGQR